MKLIYIAGCTHSGSTLLNRVLGTHPQAISLGSVKKLHRILTSNTPCCCGAPSLLECDFWREIDNELQKSGKSLRTLKLQSSDQALFAAENSHLFTAVVNVTGAKVIIDSSRRSSRLRRLHAMPGLEVIPVHLYKHPLNQMGSWRRRGRNLVLSLFGYWTRHVRVRAESRKNPRTLLLSYEQFCQNPESELRRLLTAFGLDYDENILAHWGEERIHTLGGNDMKFRTSSEIVLDESWRKHLPALEIGLTRALCMPMWRYLERCNRKNRS